MVSCVSSEGEDRRGISIIRYIVQGDKAGMLHFITKGEGGNFDVIFGRSLAINFLKILAQHDSCCKSTIRFCIMGIMCIFQILRMNLKE